ncbi:MAG: VOC family protein [Gammaproteobacteria bacterium]
MTEPMKQHGAFSWNELMTTDVDAAKSFYGKLFGWALEDMPMSDMRYTMAKVGDQDVAGMMPMPPDAGGMPPAWGAYVTVDDVEASAKQAEALGGKILMAPRDIPDVGRFCVISDPQGAVLSMITYVSK